MTTAKPRALARTAPTDGAKLLDAAARYRHATNRILAELSGLAAVAAKALAAGACTPGADPVGHAFISDLRRAWWRAPVDGLDATSRRRVRRAATEACVQRWARGLDAARDRLGAVDQAWSETKGLRLAHLEWPGAAVVSDPGGAAAVTTVELAPVRLAPSATDRFRAYDVAATIRWAAEHGDDAPGWMDRAAAALDAERRAAALGDETRDGAR